MISELRTLLAIARFGTFSATAERIGLTQAAVSGHVRRLEEHLGMPLFARRGRNAVFNPAGLRTLERAREILERYDALADPDDGNREASLRLGAIASVQSPFLADALNRFHAAFPGTRIQVVPGLSLHLLDQVDAGELDLAVMIRPPFGLPPDLEWRAMSREPYVLIAPQTCDGRNWQDLLRTQPFLRYDRLAFGGRQVDRFIRDLPFPVNEVMQVPVQTMIALVAQGAGVALIPLAEAHLPLPEGVCTIGLGSAAFYREIGMIAASRRLSEPAIAHLAAALAERTQIQSAGAVRRTLTDELGGDIE